MVASGRLVIVNPTNIMDDQRSLFSQMLAQYRQLDYLFARTSYPVKQSDGESVSIQLTHSLLHEIKVGPDQIERHLYRILSFEPKDNLGGGSFAKVHKVLGTLHHKKSGSIKKTERPRAVKLSNLRRCGERSPELVKFAHSEAELSKQIPYLHAKNAVEMNDLHYLVMRQIPSMDLFSLLPRMYQKNPPLFSFDKQLRISINIIKALLEVHEMNIIHRDIKLENMMLDRSTGDIKLIDFGLSALASEQDIFTGGSAVYVAPEVCNRQGATKKSDIFSLGILLRLLWGSRYPDLGDKSIVQKIIDDRAKGCNDLLAFEKHMLLKWKASDDHNGLIFDVLSRMIALLPDERITLEEALDIFEEIKIQRLCQSEEQRDMLREAYKLARQLNKHPVVVGPDLNGFLACLEEAIRTAVSLLPADPLALKGFNSEHKIALLAKVNTKEDIMPLVTNAIQTFQASHVAIQSALTRSDLTEDQIEDLQLILNKFKRPRFTLDDIASIGSKAQTLLNALEPVSVLTMHNRG